MGWLSVESPSISVQASKVEKSFWCNYRICSSCRFEGTDEINSRKKALSFRTRPMGGQIIGRTGHLI
uniref:Uncharacterized protein n=1 Tax=Salix viminalis TaxID=40686 RepID=A0A6N2KFD4_SALVM